MKYRITIDEVVENGERFDSHREVYKQVIDDLKIDRLVAMINMKEAYIGNMCPVVNDEA